MAAAVKVEDVKSAGSIDKKNKRKVNKRPQPVVQEPIEMEQSF